MTVDRLPARSLDFILKMPFADAPRDLSACAVHGVWSFCVGDPEKYLCPAAPGFWEVYDDDPVTVVALQRLTDSGLVELKRAVLPTERRAWTLNLQRALEGCWHLPRWVCLEIRSGTQGCLGPEAPLDSAHEAKRTAPPNALHRVWFRWLRLRNWIRYKIDNQRIDVWNVGVVRAPQHRFLDPGFLPEIEWSGYREDAQMIADPFPLPDSGGDRILAEEFNWSSEKGRLIEIRRNTRGGSLSEFTVVCDERRHMSYPFIFEHRGDMWMLPECAQSQSIPLYRLDPDKGIWRYERPLIDGLGAVDATVFQYQDRWYLMHSGTSGCGPWSLYIWHAESPLDRWTPHPANPVKTDVASSRPGGNVFWHEGTLYRPAQDGRFHYGFGLVINRIDELSPVSYRETTVRAMGPFARSPYPDGFHTLSGTGDVTVVDGKKHTWPLGLIFRRLIAKRLKRPHRGFRYTRMTQAGPMPVELSAGTGKIESAEGDN